MNGCKGRSTWNTSCEAISNTSIVGSEYWVLGVKLKDETLENAHHLDGPPLTVGKTMLTISVKWYDISSQNVLH